MHKIDQNGILKYQCLGSQSHFLNLNKCIGFKKNKYDIHLKNFSEKCQFCRINNFKMSCYCVLENKKTARITTSLFDIIWRYMNKQLITCIKDA